MEKEIECGKVHADLRELHRRCSDLDACPSCDLLRTDLAKLVSQQHALEELAEALMADKQTFALCVHVIQLQKDKDNFLGQLKATEALSQKRKEKLDGLDVEAVNAEIKRLRETKTALVEATNALQTEKSNAEKALGSAQKELNETKAAIQEFRSCRKQAEALELARGQKLKATMANSSLEEKLLDMTIKNVELRASQENWEEEDLFFLSYDNGEKIGSLLQLDELSPQTDLELISSIVICDNVTSSTRKRNATDQSEQPPAKRLRTSAEIAETARRVEGWLDKPGQATLSHHTQHLALQSMIAVGAIDPILTRLGSTGIVSLSDEGLKLFRWAQEYEDLKTRKDAGELSERFAGEIQKLFQRHSLNEAGNFDTKELFNLSRHAIMYEVDVHKLLLQLRQVLVSVQPLRQKLHNTLERIGKVDTSDADFISCVDELKESVIPALFSVYTSEPGMPPRIEPVLERELHCSSDLHGEEWDWRRRVRRALTSVVSKYKDLEDLKAEFQLEWRPAYLLSDEELKEISVCPEHTGPDLSAS